MIRPEVAMLRDDPRYGVVRDRLNLPPEPTKWRWNLLRQLHLFDQSPSTIRR
jgi:hypothetical protein